MGTVHPFYSGLYTPLAPPKPPKHKMSGCKCNDCQAKRKARREAIHLQVEKERIYQAYLERKVRNASRPKRTRETHRPTPIVKERRPVVPRFGNSLILALVCVWIVCLFLVYVM